MISRSREYLDDMGMPPIDMLRSVIYEHQVDMERMMKLKRAYDGNTEILRRQRRDGLPNNRIAHPYARYITAIATGYLIGQPVAYTMTDDNETLQAILDLFKRGSEAAENVEIARDQSIYGKGVEYVHIDEDMPHVTAIDPRNAFVVYSDTYDMEPLFGVYYIPKRKSDGSPDGWRVWVMSVRQIARYEGMSIDDISSPAEVTDHYFGGVPLVEYWNDDNERGDFEWVLPLIDAYDKLQSDRVNDKEQFVDRLLVLTGAVLEEDEKGRAPMQQLREDHALQLPDSQSKAEYLTSEMHESDVEVLRAAIVSDIHKLSMIPDMSDQEFASNASGVAMRYKMMAFEQIIRIKERWFTEGLRTRLKLLINYLNLRGSAALDVSDIKITFTHALPANLQENAQIVQLAMASGAASLETAVKMLHSGDEWTNDDIDKEIKAIKGEQREEALLNVADDVKLDGEME